jgi:selenide,water dikinase
LDRILAAVPRWPDENVLIGFDTADDAGVYQLTAELALVQTVDFLTPIVDDPYTYGAIAAANALSDVYAMGGRPLSSLSLLACPARDVEDVQQIVRGGAEKMHEAGCSVIGGHSVADEEIKFGYAVTGTVHPQRVKANSGARPGDALVLTKPLGTGVVSTALKRGIARAEDVEASTASMLALNREACDAMVRLDAHGCTDVTGFGLIGHAREVALASGVTLEIETERMPFLPGAVEYSLAGAVPGGLKNNREFAGPCVESLRAVPGEIEALLYDPQTSGGLLIALPEDSVEEFLRALPGARRIGRAVERAAKPVRLI